MTSYIEQVAEMLGVKLEEKFKVIYNTPNRQELEGVYYFCKNGLIRESYGLDRPVLAMLLESVYAIEKLPYKPKKDEVYFIPNIEDGVAWSTECYWGDNYEDRQRYRAGVICKTKEKAVKKAQFMLDALRGYCND